MRPASCSSERAANAFSASARMPRRGVRPLLAGAETAERGRERDHRQIALITREPQQRLGQVRERRELVVPERVQGEFEPEVRRRPAVRTGQRLERVLEHRPGVERLAASPFYVGDLGDHIGPHLSLIGRDER